MWYQLKEYSALLLGAINLVLLVWTVRAYRRKVSLPALYYRLLPVSAGLAAILVGVGLWFLLRGLQPDIMHIFYGCLVSLGVIGQSVLASRLAVAHRYRSKPLVHAFLALFVMLLTARAYMSS